MSDLLPPQTQAEKNLVAAIAALAEAAKEVPLAPVRIAGNIIGFATNGRQVLSNDFGTVEQLRDAAGVAGELLFANAAVAVVNGVAILFPEVRPALPVLAPVAAGIGALVGHSVGEGSVDSANSLPNYTRKDGDWFLVLPQANPDFSPGPDLLLRVENPLVVKQLNVYERVLIAQAEMEAAGFPPGELVSITN